jgi:hypothetical protein
VLRIYEQNDQKTAIQFVGYVIARLPFGVETIQTDGAEFHSRSVGTYQAEPSVIVTSIPATLRLNAKIECSHWIGVEEFHRMPDGVMIDDTRLVNDKLVEWEILYNHDCVRRPGSLRNARQRMQAQSRINVSCTPGAGWSRARLHARA